MTDLAEATFVCGMICNNFANDLREQMANNDPKLIPYIVKAISPLLRGFSPEIQSSVLADLLSIFLASHIGPDAPQVRELLLNDFVGVVRDLIPASERMILERLETEGNA